MAERSKAWVCDVSLAGIAGSNLIRATDMGLCECCVLSGRGLCDGPIPLPETSYRMWVSMRSGAIITLYTYIEKVECDQTKKEKKLMYLVFHTFVKT